MLYEEITDKIIKAFFTVYNTLGYGFLEKVYENAMLIELQKCGFNLENQEKLNAYYMDLIVGEYYADIIVENKVIIEIKVCDKLCKNHEAQLLNYLKATEIEVGLLLNFGPRAEFKRKIFSNDRKNRPRMTRI
jgi:GxxExxY protein